MNSFVCSWTISKNIKDVSTTIKQKKLFDMSEGEVSTSRLNMHTQKRELFYFLIMIILADSFVNKEYKTRRISSQTVTMNLRALLEWQKKSHVSIWRIKQTRFGAN
jgi:hypothetical protein